MFNPSARVDSAMYILSKAPNEKDSSFMKLNELYEGKRFDSFDVAYDDFLNKVQNKYNFTVPQSKLKIIKSYPFIYWISDEFREKFKSDSVENLLKNCDKNYVIIILPHSCQRSFSVSYRLINNLRLLISTII